MNKQRNKMYSRELPNFSTRTESKFAKTQD